MSCRTRSEALPAFSQPEPRKTVHPGSEANKRANRLTSRFRARLRPSLLPSCIAALVLCGAFFIIAKSAGMRMRGKSALRSGELYHASSEGKRPCRLPGTSRRISGLYKDIKDATKAAPVASTLVIYVFSFTDPEYERNLHFFVQHGMWEGDGCQYVIVIQQDDKQFEPAKVPVLPSNARYVFHENNCYDWGTIGWAIQNRKVDTSLYRYIILMNSSVRGPFLPPYFPKDVHWSKAFTERLNKNVKLVGSTISCEAAFKDGNVSNVARHNAHVQSYVMATDQVGIKVLEEDGQVLACHENMTDAVFYAEVGASAAIMKQGYTIDALMLRYQGIDWRNHSNWNCNARLNPYAEFAYDGLLLNPLEVLFVKVKGFQVQNDWMSTVMATTYDRWLSEDGEEAVSSNLYNEKKSSYRLSKVITMLIRGPLCFDFNLYRSKSVDLAPLTDNDKLWQHFVRDGQFEGRVFRFTCANPLQDNSVAETILEKARLILSEPWAKLSPANV